MCKYPHTSIAAHCGVAVDIAIVGCEKRWTEVAILLVGDPRACSCPTKVSSANLFPSLTILA
jgi:hypothetical protein